MGARDRDDPRLHGDVCVAIGKWRKAGYPRADVRDAKKAIFTFAPTRGMERRAKDATWRMVELGVSRKDAAAFSLG